MPKSRFNHNAAERFKPFIERMPEEFTLKEFVMKHPFEDPERLKKLLQSSINRRLIIKTGNGQYKRIYEED